MSNMCSLTDVRVETVEHDNHSFGLTFGGVSICGQINTFSDFITDFEVNKVHVRESMVSLRIRMVLF